MEAVPSIAQEAVLVSSSEMPSNSVPVRGYDFNQGVDYAALLASYATRGYQATSLGLAIEEINRMVGLVGDRQTDSCLLNIYMIFRKFSLIPTLSSFIHFCVLFMHPNRPKRKWRLSDVPVAEDEDEDFRSGEVRLKLHRGRYYPPVI